LGLAETEGGGILIETVYGMGYRLKLPSGQEITAPLAGTGAMNTAADHGQSARGLGAL